MANPNLRTSGLLAVLFAVSLYGGARHWIENRQFTLLESQISLIARQTNFSLHVENEGNYNLFLLVWPREDTPVRTAWTIERETVVLQRGAKEVRLGEEVFLGNIFLKRGEYKLGFKVLTDARQLDTSNPKLYLTADPDTYHWANDRYENLVIVSAVVGTLGVFLILFSFRRKPIELPIPTGVAVEAPDKVKRFPGYGRRLGLAHFGYIAAVLFALMVMVMMLLTGFNRSTPRGLWVKLLKPGEVPRTTDQWTQPIIVRVTTTLRPASEREKPWFYAYDDHYFLNGEEVTEDQLKARLRQLLVMRPDRTVFIDGSTDATFMAVAHAIDVAKGAYASRVVLLTGGTPQGR